MGADLYLSSVYDPFAEKFWNGPEAKRRVGLDPMSDIERIFNALESSGGYFRDAYNDFDVMWAMGLSWCDTVSSMLDDDTIHLPIERAKELVALIESRPLTKEVLTRHYLENIAGGSNHPLQEPVGRIAREAGLKATQLETPPFEEISRALIRKRQALLDLLNKSIKLNEPLVCDI
jgi:hypothetical protein